MDFSVGAQGKTNGEGESDGESEGEGKAKAKATRTLSAGLNNHCIIRFALTARFKGERQRYSI
jgi:hypothetical protein